MNEEESKKARFASIRTRLTLVVVGLVIGFAARWIAHFVSDTSTERHFVPVEELDEKIGRQATQE